MSFPIPTRTAGTKPFPRSHRWVLTSLLLGLLFGTGTPQSVQGQFQSGSYLPAVVTVEYIDVRGLALRTSNGVLLRQGLLVPYSSLNGATKIEAHGRDGKMWSTDRLVALHPDADLALLPVSDIPSYAIDVPRDASFTKGGDIFVLRGPGGSGEQVVEATLHAKFNLQGPDFLAVSAGHSAGAPAFKPDGKLVGICFDLSEAGFPLTYLVSTASVQNLIGSRANPVSLASMLPPVAPFYTVRSEPEGLTFRGALLTAANRPEDARNFINFALKKDPEYAEPHFWLGRILFAEQDYENAALSFKKAGELDPDYHMAWHMAGASYNQAGRYNLAIEMYEKALQANSRSALTYCNIGGTHYNVLAYDKAEEAFEKSISIDPTYGLAYFNLALMLKQTGKDDQAEAVYLRLKEKNPDWAGRLRRALDNPTG